MPVKKFRWYARVVYERYEFDQTLLSFLTTCLTEPSFTIIEKECRHYLVSTEFEPMIDQWDVLECARKYLPILNSLIELKFLTVPFIHGRISVDGIYELSKEGRLVKARARFEFDTKIEVDFTKNYLKTTNGQRPTIQELWTVARNHPEIEEAVNYYDKGYGWVNKYKIYEVIRKDVVELEKTGALPRGTMNTWTKGRARDFEQSSHNAYISGADARHSYAGSRKVQGINPMSSRKASEFIDHLLLEWLKIKV